MPKVKIPRKSTFQDMTAMCDVAFLLLTFFILTSTMTQKEPIQVTTPSSISEIKIPETNIMTILVSTDGKIFFGIDGQDKRIELLEKIANMYHLSFTKEEIKRFSVINSFGIPVEKLKLFINMESDKRDLKGAQEGMPIDSLNNQFKSWASFSREINPKITVAIKADQGTPYPIIKRIMDTLVEIKINNFNLITAKEEAPKNI
jgi:biopolymer transport protein ExbD